MKLIENEIKGYLKYYLIDLSEFEEIVKHRFESCYNEKVDCKIESYILGELKLEVDGVVKQEIMIEIREDILKSIGYIKINDNKLISLELDSFFIRRSLFNSLTISNINANKIRSFNSNINYILNLSDLIISKKDKDLLMTKNHVAKIDGFRLTSTLSVDFNINKNSMSISYKLKLAESFSGKTFYVGLSTESVFKRVLNKYLSQKYTLNVFGKKIDKLNKKEREVFHLLYY